MLSNGALANVKNNQGQTPGEVATDSNVRRILGAIEENGNINSSSQISARNASKFVPNYLQNPSAAYRPDNDQAKPSTLLEDPPAKFENSSNSVEPSSSSPAVILKVRISRSNDPDFIEVDLPEHLKTMTDLKELLCHELKVNNPDMVERIRKLPNTRLRRDIEVSRLEDYTELELVLMSK